jgi:hypothetical protein
VLRETLRDADVDLIDSWSARERQAASMSVA